MRCGCGRDLIFDLTGMERRCGGCQRPSQRCACARISGFNPTEDEADRLEQAAADGTATDVVMIAEETRAPAWYVGQMLRDHDWADEAIEEIMRELSGVKPRDEEIRPDDERIVCAPSTAGGQGGPAATADEPNEEIEMSQTNNAQQAQTNPNGPVDFLGVQLYNPQAKALAGVLIKQQAKGELTPETFWSAAKVILDAENYAPIGFLVRKLVVDKGNCARLIARLTGGPTEVSETMPSTSQSFQL